MLAKKRQINPIKDKLTQTMKFALQNSEKGIANYSNLDSDGQFYKSSKCWRGVHYTDCGEHSSSQDYLLENGMITNSLAVYYLEYYRRSIPRSEIKKVIKLYLYYMLDKNQQRVELLIKHYPLLPWILEIRYWIIYKIIPFRRFFARFKEDFDDEDDQPF